jgi:hypothetical protein
VLISTALILVTSGLAAGAQAGRERRQEDSEGRVKRIEIESSVWTWRKVIRQKLVIRVAMVGYTTKGRRVNSDMIQELLLRLSSPPLPLTLEALGIDRGWLDQHPSTDQPSFLKAAKRYYTETTIVDDDAEFKLDIVRMDGSRISLHSCQSQAYMLPWKITTPTREFETYDVGISHAVMRLLPDGFLNSSRISGEPHGLDFLYEIGLAPR